MRFLAVTISCHSLIYLSVNWPPTVQYKTRKLPWLSQMLSKMKNSGIEEHLGLAHWPIFKGQLKKSPCKNLSSYNYHHYSCLWSRWGPNSSKTWYFLGLKLLILLLLVYYHYSCAGPRWGSKRPLLCRRLTHKDVLYVHKKCQPGEKWVQPPIYQNCIQPLKSRKRRRIALDLDIPLLHRYWTGKMTKKGTETFFMHFFRWASISWFEAVSESVSE